MGVGSKLSGGGGFKVGGLAMTFTAEDDARAGGGGESSARIVWTPLSTANGGFMRLKESSESCEKLGMDGRKGDWGREFVRAGDERPE